MNEPRKDTGPDFYIAAVQVLHRASIPFLVGGAYALREYTGVLFVKAP
jgi:hypothetical protein